MTTKKTTKSATRKPAASPEASQPPADLAQDTTIDTSVGANPKGNPENVAARPTVSTPGAGQVFTKPNAAQPVTVNNVNRRSDADGLEGHFVDIVAGESKGRRGVFEQTVSHDDKTGYPDTILVRTRDARSELLTVAYKDVRPAEEYHGGR